MISHCKTYTVTRPGSAEIFIFASPDLAMTDRLWSLKNSYIHLEPGSFTFGFVASRISVLQGGTFKTFSRIQHFSKDFQLHKTVGKLASLC